LVLESHTDLRVVESQSRSVTEAFCQLELVLVELSVFADAIDVQRTLQHVSRNERDRDQRFGLRRRAGNDADARIEVGRVRPDRLAMNDRPARDADTERGCVAHHLLFPLTAHEHRNEQLVNVVGLVDGEIVVGNEVAHGVRDLVQQVVEALLGEHLVEDVREAAVRLHDRLGAREGIRLGGDEPNCRSARRRRPPGVLGRAHRVKLSSCRRGDSFVRGRPKNRRRRRAGNPLNG
jgi:hypothetical protein